MSAMVLMQQNKMATDQKILKPNLDDISGHMFSRECKIVIWFEQIV